MNDTNNVQGFVNNLPVLASTKLLTILFNSSLPVREPHITMMIKKV
jgi:hypothetical protein